MSILEYFGMRPTMDRFAARLLRAIPQDEDGQWSYDASNEMLRHCSNGEISLNNLFREYCSNKASDRKGLILKYADLATAASREVPELWVAAAKSVFPTIRSAFVDSSIRIKNRANGTPASPAAAFPFAGDLEVRLMYDFGTFLGYVNEENLATWGQDSSDVLARAVANLGRLDTPVWEQDARGFHRLTSPMSFGESMLQLDSVVNALPYAEFAVLLPCNRGILLAADGRSESAMHALLEEGLRCSEQEPWPMTATLCTPVQGGWREFEISGEHAALAHSLFVLNRAKFYADQQDCLDGLNEAAGKDVFNATYTIFGSEDNWESYCVWADGVVASLPVTDWVFFCGEDPEAKPTRARWQRVMEICGDLMRPTEESPARFEVETFPDAGRLAALSEAGT